MPETALNIADSYYDVFYVPLSSIYLDEDFNCRGHITSESVESLARSIEQERLKMPIVLQPMSDVAHPVEGFDFRIIAGHRRFKAFERLNRDKIPAFIRLGEDARKVSFENFIENAERQNLSLIAEARWLRSTFPSDTSIAEIARELKRSVLWVTTRYRALDLPSWVIERIENGDLGIGDVGVIVRNHDPSGKARAILKAKADPKGWKAPTRKRTKTEIQKLMKRMLKEGYSVQFIQLLGWCIGEVSDEVLEETLKWLQTKKAWLK